MPGQPHKYNLCLLGSKERKKKLSSGRIRKNRKSGGGICPAGKVPRCLRSKKHKGMAKCVKRPSKRSKSKK